MVRVRPLTWFLRPIIRLEVIGCSTVYTTLRPHGQTQGQSPDKESLKASVLHHAKATWLHSGSYSRERVIQGKCLSPRSGHTVTLRVRVQTKSQSRQVSYTTLRPHGQGQSPDKESLKASVLHYAKATRSDSGSESRQRVTQGKCRTPR